MGPNWAVTPQKTKICPDRHSEPPLLMIFSHSFHAVVENNLAIGKFRPVRGHLKSTTCLQGASGNNTLYSYIQISKYETDIIAMIFPI